MPKLFNREYKKQELLRRVGDMAQLADACEMELTTGKGRGVRIIEVKNGSGLCFNILPDRAMDIVGANFKGMPVSYLSKTGITSPHGYLEEDFMKNFYCGLLTTCGLTYMGAACEDEGKRLGLHGPASCLPACDVAVAREWQGDDYVLSVRGKIEQSHVFGEKVSLTREITTKMGENAIAIHDVLENLSFAAQPIMMLYHFNFGFPLLDECSTFHTNCMKHAPRDEQSEPGVNDYEQLGVPISNYKEHVFYHTEGENDRYGEIINPRLGLKVRIAFSANELPVLVQWKQLGEGDYVLGIEPGTWNVDGRAKARQAQMLNDLPPLGKREFSLRVLFQEIPALDEQQ